MPERKRSQQSWLALKEIGQISGCSGSLLTLQPRGKSENRGNFKYAGRGEGKKKAGNKFADTENAGKRCVITEVIATRWRSGRQGKGPKGATPYHRQGKQGYNLHEVYGRLKWSTNMRRPAS